ncbi:MAG: hypothetical protein UX80_C0018G0015 [Candidatus Amesbacteria bacterium GW2011_GWA2_47_11b]|uniref:Uncharacterized protein n=1 Tax=Candidatus Amesbacteria bacterium GW2011_GWA2_47_11b TaxID=1618358 RepID=A0A0G1RJP3_9BACT|nr:MAG: hypothetical protein UX80_C0018G0015 [Candidatus Amesbacteria bacterium GW2011_GWA2_47_11b]
MSGDDKSEMVPGSAASNAVMGVARQTIDSEGRPMAVVGVEGGVLSVFVGRVNEAGRLVTKVIHVAQSVAAGMFGIAREEDKRPKG